MNAHGNDTRYHSRPVHVGLLVDGRIVHTADETAIHDPGSVTEVVGYAAKATEADTGAAVASAARAWPSWAALPPGERAGAVSRGVAAVLRERDRLAELLSLENGKLRSEAAMEFVSFENRCRIALDRAAEVSAGYAFAGPPARSYLEKVPVGVVTIIIPFNWPIAILSSSLAFALVAGNSVIVKPPPTAPLAVAQAMQLLGAALPPGVLNVVTGDNDAMGPLLSDPAVAHVVFTGSTAAGKHIMRSAAENLTPVTLELGGNDPAVLLDRSWLDPDHLAGIAAAAFATAGQVCMAVKRVYVPRDRFADAAELLTATLEKTVVGHGLSADATMGPLHSARQRDRVAAMVDAAEAGGAEVRRLGRFGASVDESSGHYLLPSLVLDPDEQLEIVADEQFGPALPLIPYDDLDELVDRLNGHWAGLDASVWSSDVDRAAAVARRLRVGTVWINAANATAKDDRVPFGGFRQSGLGRALGPGPFDAFLEPRALTIPDR